jgi:hypothetical protein
VRITLPLVKTPGTEIDKSVLGLWQRPIAEGKIEQLLVLPLDKNEYLVSYPLDAKEGMFARACLCRTDDRTLVQLKWFGNVDGDWPDDKRPDDKRVFQFLSYSVSGDNLTVRLLNTDVVNKDVASMKELAKSIAANRANPNLFKEGLVFTKVQK